MKIQINRSMQRHYTVYQVTNTVNNKFYIGQHQTNKLDDNYLGSGTAVKCAIKKYGCDKFVKEVLHVFDNFDEMNATEQVLVTETLINDPMCYNQRIGGQGQPPYTSYKMTESHKNAISNAKKGGLCNKQVVKRRAETCKANRAKMSQEERNVRFGQCGEANGFYNKQHTEDSKQKIRDTIGDSRKGKYNANARSITIDNIAYQTHKECMQQLGLSKRKLKKLKKSLGI